MSSHSTADEAYDSDEPPELELDLDKLMDRASTALKAKCTTARKLTRGASHEIFTLQFQETTTAPESLVQAGFCCIARFTRGHSNLNLYSESTKSLSEIATAKYLKHFTEIPVPEIYYYDLDPDNYIGAPFVLMERMPGRHLYKLWGNLSLENKKSALSQIASVIAQLSSPKFDHIGSLDEHGVGPLISPCLDHPKGPFQSVNDYLLSFISAESTESPELKDLLSKTQEEIKGFLALNGHKAYLQPPFCLIHNDFDEQNMLFLESPDGSGLRLSGLIDFEYAYTGPLHFLYEYPIFIQDVHWSKELYAENSVLRAHFVQAVHEALPRATSARSTFIESMNEKTFAMTGFRDSFMLVRCSEKGLLNSVTSYIRDLQDGTGLAYSGRLDYTPERYTEGGYPLPPRI